jgi:hypothetical protein
MEYIIFSRSSKLHIWGIRSSLLQMVLNCGNDEKVYMQLQNIQQQTIEWMKVYYELCLLKLKNCLHFKVTCFLYHCFQGKLASPCLQLAVTSLKGNTLIEHLKTTLVCEESGIVSVDYNVC